jgi:ribonuclease R
MRDRVGDTFDGTIVSVAPFGLFVTLDQVFVDGLVHISELGRDYFHYDATRHALTGERSGLAFRLADRVRVRVARVDLEQARIDFTLADATSAARPAVSQPLARGDRPREPRTPRARR